MRLLVLTPVFPPAEGGIETLTRMLVERLYADNILVLTLREPTSEAYDANAPCTVSRVRNEPRGGRKAIARLSLHALVQGTRFRPSAIVCMHARLAPAAALLARLTGATYLQYFHAREIPTWPRSARIGARCAGEVVCVSEYTAGLLRDVTGSERVLSVVHPALEKLPASFEPAGSRAPVVLTVGRMADWYKGHDVLVESMAMVLRSLPDARWVVIGDGTRRPELQQRALDAGIADATEFLGRVDDVVRDRRLREARVLALPSRTSTDGRDGEGFGIVFLEAAAQGTPSIGPNEGGGAEAILDESTGLHVDPRDSAAVASALLRVLRDDALANRLGAAAHAWSRQHLAGDMVERVRALMDPPAGLRRVAPNKDWEAPHRR